MSSGIGMGGIYPERSNHQIMVDIQSDILKSYHSTSCNNESSNAVLMIEIKRHQQSVIKLWFIQWYYDTEK